MLGVTAFGVFLTPVFFFVIESLGQTAIMANPRVQQAGSAFWGLLIGFLVALVFHEMGWLGWPGVVLVTVGLAVLSTAIVSRLHRKIGAAAVRRAD